MKRVKPKRELKQGVKQGIAFLLGFSISLVVLSTSTAQANDELPVDPVQLEEINKLTSLESVGDSAVISSDPLALRGQAIREAAATVGIQSGIRWRYQLISQSIEKMAHELDEIYNFQPLLIEEKMMPPIITEANSSFSLKEDGSATTSMTTFEIVQDAKLVAQQPSWRDYLIHHYEANNNINPLLKPKDDNEKASWAKGVADGWKEGVDIADRMSVDNINRLTRDYRGAIRFHTLAQQGVVSVPTLSSGDIGIHVNGKKLDINQRVFRISDQPTYNTNSKDWKIISGKQVEWNKLGGR